MLTTLQKDPHLVLEETGPVTRKLLERLMEEDLPEDMSLCVNGSMFHFSTREERMQWCLGAQAVLLPTERHRGFQVFTIGGDKFRLRPDDAAWSGVLLENMTKWGWCAITSREAKETALRLVALAALGTPVPGFQWLEE